MEGGLQQRPQGQATHKAETGILVATHDLGPSGQPRLPHCVRPRADPFPPCARRWQQCQDSQHGPVAVGA